MNRVICPRCWGDVRNRCDKCENKRELYDSILSKNFLWSELVYSPTARWKNIPNDPTIRQVDRLRDLAVKVLQPIRDEFGPVQVTSGFRTPELNKAIGGAKDSAHMLGWAADLQFGQASKEDVMLWLWRGDLDFDQAILEFGKRESAVSDDWLHVGWKNSAGEQRRQMLVMRNGVYSAWQGPGSTK